MNPNERMLVVDTCRVVLCATHWDAKASHVKLGGKWLWQVDAERRGARIHSSDRSHSLAWMDALQQARRIAAAE